MKVKEFQLSDRDILVAVTSEDGMTEIAFHNNDDKQSGVGLICLQLSSRDTKNLIDALQHVSGRK